jgi:hypothetical protein
MSLVELAALIAAAAAVTVAIVVVMAWRRLAPLTFELRTLTTEARATLRRVEAVTVEAEAVLRRARTAGQGLGAVGGVLVELVPPVRKAGAVIGALRAGWMALRTRRAGS